MVTARFMRDLSRGRPRSGSVPDPVLTATVGAVVRGIDEPKVTAWLDANVDGVDGPYTFDFIAGGRSNVTFKVTDAHGAAFVLRRPPLGHVLATAHDMAREHRLISAIGQTNVPVPRTMGLCTDPDVNGAPFYVMSFVEGVVLDSPEKAEATMTVNARRAASDHLIDVLADLHAVDVDAVGLGDLARKDGYIERQLKRWTTQWESSKTRELPAIDELVEILRRRIPVQQGVSVAHGDYRFGNCLTDTTHGRIVAVLDWELCTLGDPMADVGYIGVYWREPGAPASTAADPSGVPGFPRYEDLVARYAARTGRDVSDVDYYRAFSAYRLAVIGEGVYARYLNGAMADQIADLETMKKSVEWRAESALQIARRVVP
jgi:aminoglycoside phosphotransferase (APT) family kinase protein